MNLYVALKDSTDSFSKKLNFFGTNVLSLPATEEKLKGYILLIMF